MLAWTTALLMAATSMQANGESLAAQQPVEPPVRVDDQALAPPITSLSITPTPAPVPVSPQTDRPILEATTPAPRKAGSNAGPPHDIVVVGRKALAGDPLRSVNATAFDATEAVDKAFVGPVARQYKKTVPSPIRRGIHNFLYNLREPIVFVNFLLQLKPGKAVETVGRFAINSTVGAVGVLDIAKRRPFRLPRRSNGFANTLGYYGVKNGPFLFLPLVGPTTLRDLIGGGVDRLMLPVAVGKPFTSPTYTIPAGVLGALDHRSEFDDTLKDLHDNAADPYAASREFYLRRRQAEIDHLHGRNVDAILGPGGVTEPPPRAAMPIIEQMPTAEPSATAVQPVVPEPARP
ncbi:MlaA family lipoprotein [Sphingomonas sp. Leaf198]|uniref:MlaA family lipoprotein n=2 Tax=unclassified Sphingomonas TaxID=196159 RepID=UPI000A965C90|nr:VacJ family lipoprotein [Sphingomonas sp. Leaf198]